MVFQIGIKMGFSSQPSFFKLIFLIQLATLFDDLKNQDII